MLIIVVYTYPLLLACNHGTPTALLYTTININARHNFFVQRRLFLIYTDRCPQHTLSLARLHTDTPPLSIFCSRATVAEEGLAAAETARGEALAAAKEADAAASKEAALVSRQEAEAAAATSEEVALASRQEAEAALARTSKVCIYDACTHGALHVYNALLIEEPVTFFSPLESACWLVALPSVTLGP